MTSSSNPDGITFSITIDQLGKLDRETQIEVMKRWFLENYVNPNDECPWDAEDNAYVFIWGGPYDAGDELKANFEGPVAPDVIEELVRELEQECDEWSGVPENEHAEDYFVEAISSTEDPLGNLKALIHHLQDLMDVPMAEELSQTLMRLIYVSAITTMEAYLSECFIGEVSKDEYKLRAFLESDPEFQQRKFPLAELFSQSENIRETVQQYLADLMWHKLPKIKEMYQSTLKITFPTSFGYLCRAVNIRHDLVHRGGKTKKGKETTITATQVHELLNAVLELAVHIHEANSPPY